MRLWKPTSRLFIDGQSTPIEAMYAHTWFKRAAGLFIIPRLQINQCLWISPCASVHTIAMPYTIDVVYLNRERVVQKIVSTLKPYRMSFAYGASSVLEFASGCVNSSLIQHKAKIHFSPL
jgi:uncharacterized protein